MVKAFERSLVDGKLCAPCDKGVPVDVICEIEGDFSYFNEPEYSVYIERVEGDNFTYYPEDYDPGSFVLTEEEDRLVADEYCGL